MLKTDKHSSSAVTIHGWLLLGRVESLLDFLSIQIETSVFTCYPKYNDPSTMMIHCYSVDGNGKMYHAVERDYLFKLGEWRVSQHAQKYPLVRLLIDDFISRRNQMPVTTEQEALPFEERPGFWWTKD